MYFGEIEASPRLQLPSRFAVPMGELDRFLALLDQLSGDVHTLKDQARAVLRKRSESACLPDQGANVRTFVFQGA